MLRILSERPRTSTEILNVFKIESSHLTYHLESLGELILKTEDGGYKLSALGEAAVSMMRAGKKEMEEVVVVIRDAATSRSYCLP